SPIGRARQTARLPDLVGGHWRAPAPACGGGFLVREHLNRTSGGAIRPCSDPWAPIAHASPFSGTRVRLVCTQSDTRLRRADAWAIRVPPIAQPSPPGECVSDWGH